MAAANAPITMKEALTQEILRAKKELDGKNIDYEATMTTKLSISKKIFDLEKDLILNSDSFKNFLSKNEEWLKPYVAFCFLRDFFELESLSSYMRGRLTLDKINAAISDMAAYAEANAQLIKAPRKKLTESTLEKALCMFRNGLTHKIHERLSE
ncbi:hypothetical protein SSX86_007102 [Deinandra increscens subsp. villosa]|uniref:Uncharacterized protein n=1 Tax=Deinandra increscens subsp. villosa TaxID=3103831 RepID=A0AAP0H684_9ASTR